MPGRRSVDKPGSRLGAKSSNNELARLKRENARLEEEVAFLKKAAAYFAKQPKSTAWMQEVGQRRSGCREVRHDQNE